jgi:hypothetical protein
MFYLSFFFELIAFATGLWLFKKLQPRSFKLLVMLLFITVLNEAFSFWRVYQSIGVSKNYFYTGFFFLQSVFFWNLFRDAFLDFRYKYFLNFLSIFFILGMISSIIIGGAEKLNPVFKNFVCLHIISIGGLYYYYIYNSNKISSFLNEPFFWLATGIILVNFINLFFVNAVFIKSFVQNPSSKIIYKILNTFGNIVYYSLIIYAFICSSRFQKRDIT